MGVEDHADVGQPGVEDGGHPVDPGEELLHQLHRRRGPLWLQTGEADVLFDGVDDGVVELLVAAGEHQGVGLGHGDVGGAAAALQGVSKLVGAKGAAGVEDHCLPALQIGGHFGGDLLVGVGRGGHHDQFAAANGLLHVQGHQAHRHGGVHHAGQVDFRLGAVEFHLLGGAGEQLDLVAQVGQVAGKGGAAVAAADDSNFHPESPSAYA